MTEEDRIQQKIDAIDPDVKGERVHEVFENISTDYDKMNDIISAGRQLEWKDRLLEEVFRFRPARLLDLCCGTGDMSLRYASLDGSAQIIGMDFSAAMLSVAAERLALTDLTNITFIEGDAMSMPFDDDSFDTALISFGLRNVGDYRRVIDEMARVVRPGGKVFCIDSFQPENGFIRFFYRIYFAHIMPAFGRLFAKHPDEYAWLNRSTELFLTKDELAELFRSCGLSDVSYEKYMLGAAAIHRGTVVGGHDRG